MYAHVDDEGKKHLMMSDIVKLHRYDSSVIMEDWFINQGIKEYRHKNTKGWKIMVT